MLKEETRFKWTKPVGSNRPRSWIDKAAVAKNKRKKRVTNDSLFDDGLMAVSPDRGSQDRVGKLDLNCYTD